ncbi:MAG: ATP-binding cassette domain-containing protein [Lachnospiraceae bacterium]
MNIKSKHILQKCMIVFLWLIIWQMVSLFVRNEILVAGPLETAKALLKDGMEIRFWKTVGISLFKIMGGLLAGLFTGFVLAVLSYRHSFLEQFLEPAMVFAKSVPVAGFAVILLIWWGSGFLSVAISFLVTLPLMYVNILEGLKNCDTKLLEMAALFSFSPRAKAFYLYRQSLKPFLLSGLKTGVGISIKAGVAAEVIGTPKWSIGAALYEAKIYLETDRVFAWIIVVILLGLIAEKLFLGIVSLLFARKPKVIAKARRPVPVKGVCIRNVTKSFGEKSVLQNLSYTMKEGEITCLMAPSGAGKTTLLHILAGLCDADSGEILWDGPGTPGIGMVFQEDRLLEEETALKNVEMACPERTTAKEVLSELLPMEALNKKISALSGGMKRRVCIARALAAQADVLVLDEPFTGLDEENRKKAVRVILKHLNGRIMILSTHNGEDAELLGAKVWKIS